MLISSVVAIAAVYAGDYGAARYRLAHAVPGNPLESVQIQRYYGVPQKDGRRAIVLDTPQTQTCVHAIFPHFGYKPCWYVKRQNGKEAPLGE